MATSPDFTLPEPLQKRPVDLIALGNAKLEMILQVADRPDGWGQQDTAIPLPIYSAGGCATNVACVAARLGARAQLVCRLGDGRYGGEVLNEIIASDVDTSGLIKIPGAEGNLLIISTNPAGDWSVLSYQDPALLLQPEDIPDAATFARAKLLHIDGFSFAGAAQKAAVELAIGRAHEQGCLVAIDAAVPVAQAEPGYLATLFTRCDIVFANLAEAQLVTSSSDLAGTIRGLRAFGPALACLKMGAAGSILITPDGTTTIPVYPVEVVDTLAAGDSYIAGLLTALCHGLPLVESTRWASAAGALACLGAGSLGHRFDLADVLEMVDD